MVWRWNGQGFLPGIPERDIEDSEAEELGIIATLDASPAYAHEDEDADEAVTATEAEPDAEETEEPVADAAVDAT